MIIVIKEGYGEYDDYYETIVAILEIDTNKLEVELTNEHKLFQIKLMEENEIPIYSDKYGSQPHAIKGRVKAAVKKLHRKLLKDNDFLTWVKTAYPYKQIDNFIEINN